MHREGSPIIREGRIVGLVQKFAKFPNLNGFREFESHPSRQYGDEMVSTGHQSRSEVFWTRVQFPSSPPDRIGPAGPPTLSAVYKSNKGNSRGISPAREGCASPITAR